MKSKSLDDLKGRLYESFDRVVNRADGMLGANSFENVNSARELYRVAGELAAAIVSIDREKREAAEERGMVKLKSPAPRE